MIKSVAVVNVKKNGQKGKLRYKLHLYELNKPVCKWGCSVCDHERRAEQAREQIDIELAAMGMVYAPTINYPGGKYVQLSNGSFVYAIPSKKEQE